jgi:hypothetical protein
MADSDSAQETEQDAERVSDAPAVRRVSVASVRLAGWLTGFRDRHGEIQVRRSDNTVQLSAEDGSTASIEVPFPPLAGGLADGSPGGPDDADDVLAALIAHVERPRQVGVLLVRRGGYAAGVFEGTALTSSKVGSSYVQGTTKAGGWSQQRYARRRANQAQNAFLRAADVAADVLLPVAGRLDALVVGGDRTAIEAVLADTRLARLVPLRTGRILAVPDPRLAVLRSTPEQFLAVQIAIQDPS